MSMPRFYDRPSLIVSAYDALNPTSMAGKPIAGDVQFYRELAEQQNGPVLELAVGTGRVAFLLAEAGFEVVGLDRSPAMLAVADAKLRGASAEVAGRLTFVEGDMTDFDLGRTFRLALIPFRSFGNLLTVEAQCACLGAIRRHLDPDGLLALNLFDPRLDLCVPVPPGPYPQPRGEAVLPESGHVFRAEALERHNDPLHQTLRVVWRLTERDANGAVIREELEELRLRWTYRYELHHLLELSGFEVVADYGDLAKGPPAYGGEIVIVARPALPPT
jgi:SAM-dependent methyltransferase